jgi:DNA-binding NtrC family response regulator/tetratricopeptide (TPR) repeat protein
LSTRKIDGLRDDPVSNRGGVQHHSPLFDRRRPEYSGDVLPLDQLLGESAAIVAVRHQVERLLRREREGGRRLPPVLILGETGTGKGLLAGALHRAGSRTGGPFVDVNCAAIPETLLEAELFGFERGAFTDARQAKAGLFQAAHRGTLFLDEVGLLPLALQAKLLKVLEEQSVRRLGSTRTEPVDVWLLAATSEDLPAAIRAGRFREDLYHRLAVVALCLRPLRERGDDVILLAAHLLARACEDYGLPPRTLAPDAEAALRAYAWPGNVRELANVMERVTLLSESPTVTALSLGLVPPSTPAVPRPAPVGELRAAAQTAHADAERARLLEALQATGWKLAPAAARLGLPRSTLRYRMEKRGLGQVAVSPGPAARPEETLAPRETDERGTMEMPVPPDHAPPPESGGPRPAGVRWERRRVGVLRVRLGSEPAETDISEAGRAMAAVLDKVRSFGGHIDELSPYGVLAIFGLDPVEDAPQLAAYAAMAIEREAARAGPADSARPAVRVAVHTDRLLVGRHDGGAAIDADAKRAACAVLDTLAAAAEPGVVVVSPQAATFLARRVELAVLGPIATVPGTAFRVVGPGGVTRRLTGFFGREAELALLRERLEQARLGRGQVVTIVGEPGIGKSRLLRELRHQVAAVATWAEGHAIPHGRAIPFHPLADLLRRTFEIDDADPRAAIVEKIERHVLAVDEQLRPALPFLRYLLAGDPGDAAVLAMDPHVRRIRLFEALQSFLFGLAVRRPLVVVCEDAHWVDQGTEEYLTLMVESLATARIVLILTVRPGDAPPLGDRTYCTRLPLAALSMEDSLEMARGLLGAPELPDELQGFITGRAEGNPFFVEELVRSLQEVGAVRRIEDRLVLARRLDETAVPETIQDVILARIERLGGAARETLGVAAVLGKDVPLVLLRAIADVPEETLQDVLVQLRAAEFLYETRLLPEREYTFKHALTHDVAYAGLAPERRRSLHAGVVAAIERLYYDRLDDHIERLAHHAVHGEVWGKAVGYLRRAGARAFERSANRAAAAYFEQALTALDHLPETTQTIEQGIDLRFDLRNALFPITELDRIARCLHGAQELATRLDDRRRLGWVAAYMSSHLWMTGRSGAMRAVAEALQHDAEALGDLPLEVAANAYLGAACLVTGDYRAGERFLRTNLQRLEHDLGRQRLGLTVFPAVNARSRLAWCLAERGKFGEGASLGEDGLRMAEALDHPFSLVTACTLLAYLYRVKGDWSRAQPLLDRGLALCREWGVTLWAPILMGSLGAVSARSGAVARGLSLIQDALAQCDATGLGFFHTLIVVQLGETYLNAGRIEDGRACGERAVALGRERGERGYEGWALRLLGEAASRATPPDTAAARERYREALELADGLGMRPLVARCRFGLGWLHTRAGDHQLAAEHLKAAEAMYRDMDMQGWLYPEDRAFDTREAD